MGHPTIELNAAVSAGVRTRTGRTKPSGHDSSRIRRALRFFALDPHHAVRDLAIGFTLAGVAMAINIGIYALAGWYHVGSVRFDVGPFLLGGLLGFLWVGFYEEFLFRGIAFRVLEVTFGSIAALVLSSLAFGLCISGIPERPWWGH